MGRLRLFAVAAVLAGIIAFVTQPARADSVVLGAAIHLQSVTATSGAFDWDHRAINTPVAVRINMNASEMPEVAAGDPAPFQRGAALRSGWAFPEVTSNPPLGGVTSKSAFQTPSAYFALSTNTATIAPSAFLGFHFLSPYQFSLEAGAIAQFATGFGLAKVQIGPPESTSHLPEPALAGIPASVAGSFALRRRSPG